MERAAYVGRVATELSLGQAFQILESFDFGDSGAFAEVHVPQFPGGMGRDVLGRSRVQKTSAIDSMRMVSRHHNVSSSGGSTTVAEVVEGGLWGASAAMSRPLAITDSSSSIQGGGAAAAGEDDASGAAGTSSTQVSVVSSSTTYQRKPLPANATPIASVLHRAREQHLNAARKIEEAHGGTDARAPEPSYSTALVLPTGVVLPPSEMAPEEETQIRKENGGLLVVHTAQSAGTTKHFSAEELAKPTTEETDANIDRTKNSLQAKLDALQESTGVGSFKVKKVSTSSSSALVLHSGVDGEQSTFEVDNAVDPFAPTNRKALKLDRSQLVTTEDADPAPIIRSPTGPRKTHGGFSADAIAAAEKKLVSVPAVVNNYRNNNGQIFTLEERLKAENSGVKVNVLSQSHKDVALGLRRAQQEHEVAAAERDKARLEEEERKKLDQDQQATEMAKQVIASRAAAAAGGAPSHDRVSARPLSAGTGAGGSIGFGEEEEQQPTTNKPTGHRETREERLERVKHERENRARERETKHRVSKLEATARRLGISLESLEKDHDLMSKIDKGGESGTAGKGGDDDVFDVRVHSQLNVGVGGEEDAKSGGGGGASRGTTFIKNSGGFLSGTGGGMVGVAGVQQELKRMQELRDSGEQQVLPPLNHKVAASSSDDDDDDDPLKLKSLGHKRARED